MSSNDIERQIQAEYAARPELSGLKVDAVSSTRQVQVSGTVRSEVDRDRALDIADKARTGYTVSSDIQVKPVEVSRTEYTKEMAVRDRERAEAAGDKVGQALDDAWIHAKITAKLVTDKDTPARKINVDVDRNVVTLRGSVESADAKAEAERLAKETDSVKRVVNRLRVRAS